jgi:flagellar hook-associated protein 3 FlgL
MRVTDDMITRTTFSNIERLSERIFTLTKKSTTGREVQRASDDPLAARLILEYRNSITRIDQWAQNIDEGVTFLSETESILSQVEELMNRVKEMAMEGIDAGSEGNLEALADEADDVLDDLMGFANTRVLGRYLFGGTETLDAPFTLDPGRTAVTVNTDTSGDIRVEVGDGAYETINVGGEDVFTDTVDMFDLVIRLRDALQAGDTDALQTVLTDAETAIDHILVTETGVGNSINDLNALSTFLAGRKLQLEGHLSRLEDADIARVMIELQEAQIVYQSAAASIVNLFQNNLLTFLT